MGRLLSKKNEINTTKVKAKEIKKLNETKQYTIMATGLLESILTDPNLISSSAKLWEFLYAKAIGNESLSIRIRYKDLAVKFNRTERTIKRYVENLKENGYLYIESNYQRHGQRANTYYVQLPERLLKELQSTKDRKKLVSSIDDRSLHLNSELFESKLNPNINDSLINTMPDTLKSMKNDNIVTPGHDTNDTVKNNIIKKEIIRNNNVVSYNQFSKLKAPRKERNLYSSSIIGDNVPYETSVSLHNKGDNQEILSIKNKVSALFKKMGNASKENKISMMKEINHLEARASVLKVLMEQRSQSINAVKLLGNTAVSSNFKINPNINFATLEGERYLSSTELQRIEKFVTNLTGNINTQQRICNEIIFSVRFGSLRLKLTGETLTTSHAISIALKLLRENRWETPTQLSTPQTNPHFFSKNNKTGVSKGY